MCGGICGANERERSCAEATFRSLAEPGGDVGRVNCDEVRDAMGSMVDIFDNAGWSVEVRRCRVRSSGVVAKLVLTALHQASILLPSLAKFRRRFPPGELPRPGAVLPAVEMVLRSGAKSKGSAIVIGVAVVMGWNEAPAELAPPTWAASGK